jgi:hypothetical protein
MRKVNPAAKNANRAYVRLHTYVTKQFDWDLFTKDYRVVLHTDEDGGVTLYIVKVFDKDGQPAALGPKIPNQITFSYRQAPIMSVWTEFFNDGKFSWRNVSCR